MAVGGPSRNVKADPCSLLESIDLANEIEKLNEKIGIPRNLKEMGITEDLIPNLVAHAKEDPSNLTTPRLPSQKEWEELFLDCLLYTSPSPRDS